MAGYLMRPDILGLLYSQHRNHNDQLALTFQALGKLYNKLAKAERVLAERKEQQMIRTNKKKWQYTRALTKKNIERLDFRSRELQDHIGQCNNLIAWVEQQGSYRGSGSAPWSSFQQMSPLPYSPFTPGADSHWPSMSQGSTAPETESRPQYWDLSMLPERRSYSPQSSLTDSGYCEPPAVALGVEEPRIHASDHVFAHELMSPLFAPFNGGFSTTTTPAVASPSARDRVPELRVPTSPTTVGASQHKRCFSAGNPTSFMVENLSISSSKRRGASVGPAAKYEAHGEKMLASEPEAVNCGVDSLSNS
jgi:hypothetical protein